MRNFLLICCLVWSPVMLAAPVERLPQRLVTTISAPVVVGADGALRLIGELSVKLDPLMKDLVLDEMRAAHFEPGRINGEPAEVNTNLSVTLGLRDGAMPGEFLLEVVKVGTGPSMRRVKPPKYPSVLLAQGREALVTTHLRFDANGKVTDAAVLSSSTPEPQLEKEVLRAVRSWRFTPELVAGNGMAGEAFVPIHFSLGSTSSFRVRLASGTRLQFWPEKPVDEREQIASAVETEFEAGRILPTSANGS